MSRINLRLVAMVSLIAAAVPAHSQMQDGSETRADLTPMAQPAPPVATAPPGVIVLPADTMIQVTPIQEITSKKMKVGDDAAFQVVGDVVQSGVPVIPRGAPVKGKVIWRTGKGIGGKSAKFEVAFESVSIGGRSYTLKGKHRQEGRGNTVAALLGSMLISGRSAIMTQGQVVNAFTAEPISIR